MESDGKHSTSGDGSPNTVGCGLATLLGGIAILSFYYFDPGMGRGPIGTVGAVIFGGILVLAGVYRVVAGIAGRRR